MTTLVKRLLIGMGMAGSLALGWATSETSLVRAGTARTAADAVGQPASPSRSDDDRVVAAIAALRQDMDRLGGKVAGLGAEVARIERQRPGEGAAAAADAEAQDDPQGDAPAQAAGDASQQMDRVLDAAEASFRAEKVDAQWASQVGGTIAQAFAGSAGADPATAPAEETLAGTSLDKVECRSTSCRLEVSHADPEAFEGFVHGFPSKLGGKLPLMTLKPARSADGSLTTVVYLSRKR